MKFQILFFLIVFIYRIFINFEKVFLNNHQINKQKNKQEVQDNLLQIFLKYFNQLYLFYYFK
mgnify:CR=1 FL=1